MILLIDNYDSFTWNLVHLIAGTGAEVVLRRNDALSVQDAMAMRPQAIVLSPGPRSPEHAGICLSLVEAAAEAELPLLGVCLGHQTIGQAFGGKIVEAAEIRHGKIDQIHHQGGGVLAGLPSPFDATRYHSLCIDPQNFPDALQVTASAGDGTIMAVSHKHHAIHGVQFHPESIATQFGETMIRNFLTSAKIDLT